MIESLLRSRRYLLLAVSLVVCSLLYLILEEIATHQEASKHQPAGLSTDHQTHPLSDGANGNHTATASMNHVSGLNEKSAASASGSKDTRTSPVPVSSSSFWVFETIMALTACVSYFATKKRQEIICARVMERINRQLACGV